MLAAQAMRRWCACPNYEPVSHRPSFESSYPKLAIPVEYGNIEDIPKLPFTMMQSSPPSIHCFLDRPGTQTTPRLEVGYYIQDYEPYFYAPDTDIYQKAADSIPHPKLVRCVTTQWIDDQIQIIMVFYAISSAPAMIQTCSGLVPA